MNILETNLYKNINTNVGIDANNTNIMINKKIVFTIVKTLSSMLFISKISPLMYYKI